MSLFKYNQGDPVKFKHRRLEGRGIVVGATVVSIMPPILNYLVRATDRSLPCENYPFNTFVMSDDDLSPV